MKSFCTAKKFQIICVSLDVNFNESLTNDVVSFEQLGPVFTYILLRNEPKHSNYYSLTCAPSEDSDKPAHPHSLIRVFAGGIELSSVISYP